MLYGLEGANEYKVGMRRKSTTWNAWILISSGSVFSVNSSGVAVAVNNVSVTAALPTSTSHLTRKDYVDKFKVYGELKMLPAGTTAPAVGQGWLPAKGGLFLRADYPDLYAAIAGVAKTEAAWTTSTNGGLNGTVLWSTGDLSTTFRVPDFEGEFIRGNTGDVNRDPDQPGRAEDWQADEFKSHTHTEEGSTDAGDGTNAGGGTRLSAAANATGAAGGDETRPRNLGVDYYIFAGGVA